MFSSISSSFVRGVLRFRVEVRAVRTLTFLEDVISTSSRYFGGISDALIVYFLKSGHSEATPSAGCSADRSGSIPRVSPISAITSSEDRLEALGERRDRPPSLAPPCPMKTVLGGSSASVRQIAGAVGVPRLGSAAADSYHVYDSTAGASVRPEAGHTVAESGKKCRAKERTLPFDVKPPAERREGRA